MMDGFLVLFSLSFCYLVCLCASVDDTRPSTIWYKWSEQYDITRPTLLMDGYLFDTPERRIYIQHSTEMCCPGPKKKNKKGKIWREKNPSKHFRPSECMTLYHTHMFVRWIINSRLDSNFITVALHAYTTFNSNYTNSLSTGRSIRFLKR